MGGWRMDTHTRRALSSLTNDIERRLLRLSRLLKRAERFELGHLKRVRRLERAALTCGNCGSVLVCPMCGHDPGHKEPI